MHVLKLRGIMPTLRRQESNLQILLRGNECAPADAHPERIGAGVVLGNFRVGDVQIPEINAPMIFPAKNVDANRARGREVESRFPNGYLARGDQSAAAEFNVGRNSPAAPQIPPPYPPA